MKRILLLLICCSIFFTACKTSSHSLNKKGDVNPAKDLIGLWRLTLELGPANLPFQFELLQENENYVAIIINGTERIRSNYFTLKDDSVYVRLPIFDSEFCGKIHDDLSVNGLWHNYTKCCNYAIPFQAEKSDAPRFVQPSQINHSANISGKWEVTFSQGTSDEYKAVGLFTQENNKAFGTFLTETGDYRFLEGNVYNDNLYLSCFDGSHAFLFTSSLNDKKELNGMFYSGKHWKEPWVAKRNDKFELSNPDSLTYIKEGYSGLEFGFLNTEGLPVNYPDEIYDDKVVIIQIMGSWCPNCMDETEFLSSTYKRYHDKGLEIISLCFESSAVFDQAVKNVLNHKNHFNAPWQFLIAGQSNKTKAAEALPMLNHIMSFPTTIFIDKKGVVRKIHTGFYGPGTGSYYEMFTERTLNFLDKLLAE